MNIESKSVSKRGKLTVTVTFSGAELSWLQHLARTELDKGETIAWALGSQMLLARELRDMTVAWTQTSWEPWPWLNATASTWTLTKSCR